MKDKTRYLWADLLKIVSMYAVILIHSSAPVLINYDSAGNSNWWIGNLYDSAARWCIPVFIMLSGCMVLDKVQKQQVSHFFLHRFQRIFIPFLLWSFFYFLWRKYGKGEILPYGSFFELFIKEPLYYHLWYLYILITLYLFSPVLGVYVKYAPTGNIIYFLIVWMFTASILPQITSFFDISLFINTAGQFSIFVYMGYFLMGYFFRDRQLSIVHSSLLVVLFLIGFFGTAYGTYFLTVVRNDGRFDGLFMEYYSFTVLLMACSIFIFFKSIPFRKWFTSTSSLLKMISGIASCIPGIYLVHAILIPIYKRGILGFTFSESMWGVSLGIPMFALLVMVTSLLIVAIIKCIPGLRYIVP